MLTSRQRHSPLAVSAIVCLATVSLALYGQLKPILPFSLALAGVAVLAFLLLPKENRLFVSVVILTAVIALLSFGIARERYEAPAKALSGKTLVCSGVLTDLPYRDNGRYYYRLTLQEIPGWRGEDVTVLVSSRQELRLEPYDRLTASLHFDSPEKNPYASTPSRGITLRGWVQETTPCLVTAGKEKPPDFAILMLRRSVKDTLSRLLPPREAAFAHAIVLGDKHSLDDSTLEEFQRAGLSHIIVISGFHLSVIVTLILLVMEKLLRQRNRPLPLIVVMVGILPYMALAGFTPSVVRAGLMVEMMMLGRLCYVRLRPKDALGGAVTLMTLFDPYLVLDVSFLLSVSATAGILLWSEGFYRLLTQWADVSRLMKRFHLKPGEGRYMVFFQPVRFLLKLYRPIAGTVAATASAVLSTMPIILVQFGTMSLYSIPANLLVSPVIFLNVVAHLVLLFCSGLPLLSFLTPLLSQGTCLLTDYVLGCAHIVSAAPWAQISSKGAPAIGYGCLIAFAFVLLHRYYWEAPRRSRAVGIGTGLLLTVLVLLLFLY